MKCPLCHAELPDNADACTRCDWVRPQVHSTLREAKAHTRDMAAMWLSLVPGLGHLYKGHVVLGGAIFFIISPIVLGLALSVIVATLGLSMILPTLFLAAVMFHAYHAEDRRGDVIEHARALNRASAVPH